VTFKQTLMTASVLAIGLSALPAMAQENISKDDLDKHIRQYIMENPEVVMQALELHQVNQQRQAEQQAASKIKSSMNILAGGDSPSIGNPDADVTIIEFFDYNCGYCKRALPDILDVVESDKNVRFVFKEMPILSPTSELAARWALAAHKQGKYFEYHSALMKFQGQKDEAVLTRLAKEEGLNVNQMKRDAVSGEVTAQIQQVSQISNEIGIRGTPAFIINGELSRGYLGPGGLERAIREAREKS
jgi:protein-disulfide isomerase